MDWPIEELDGDRSLIGDAPDPYIEIFTSTSVDDRWVGKPFHSLAKTSCHTGIMVEPGN
jgi:hypothetical protein